MKLSSQRQQNDTFESNIEAFETALANGTAQDLETFLPDDPDRRIESLNELVATELEHRIKNSEHARVEEYLARFPELGSHPEVVVNLLQFEFLIRARTEPELASEEYERRFPELRQLIFNRCEHFESILQEQQPSKRLKIPARNFLTFEERYELDHLHAVGGIGKVWVARDRQLDRLVAIKEIKHNFVDKQILQQRFEREAVITGMLEHPGVVPVYDFGELDGRMVYAMRFVQGNSLSKAIKDFHETNSRSQAKQNKHVRARRMLNQFVDICNTIHFAHTKGVLHRDIKPDNILIGEFGETLIVDWGMAKVIGEASMQSARTNSNSSFEPGPQGTADQPLKTLVGDVVGTPGYMSPEQLRGNHDKLSVQSDEYSLGATLFTILTNRIPSDDVSPQSLLQEWPRPLREICLKSISNAPEDRYESAKALADDVELFLADEPVAAYQNSLWERGSRLSRRYRNAIGVFVVSALVLTIGSVISILTIDHFRDRQIAADTIAEKTKFFAERQTKVRDDISYFLHNIKFTKESVSRAIAYCEDSKRDPDVVALVNSAIAQHYVGINEHETGLRYLFKAHPMFEESKVIDSHYTSHAYVQVAILMNEQSRFEKAVFWFEQAIACEIRSQDPNKFVPTDNWLNAQQRLARTWCQIADAKSAAANSNGNLTDEDRKKTAAECIQLYTDAEFKITEAIDAARDVLPKDNGYVLALWNAKAIAALRLPNGTARAIDAYERTIADGHGSKRVYAEGKVEIAKRSLKELRESLDLPNKH